MSQVEWEDGFKFELIAQDPDSRARLGRLTTPHGVINTPAFMPVGTYGAVKGISPDELQAAGAEIILANAMHLEFRPGSEIVARLGGLHRLMAWGKPILTDSGGFQTFSLSNLIKQKDQGIVVRSPVDGSKHTITPGKVVEIQRKLGTDFLMPLDVCTPGDADQKTALGAMQKTLEWAAQSRHAYQESKPVHGQPQAMLGIVQGGTSTELRKIAIEEILKIGFFGYAIGGLAVGEPREETWRIVHFCDEHLPVEQPRYLMGAGTPEDLDRAISLGMDLFDCVLPTRNGRKGSLFVPDGKINLRNAAFKDDPRPITEQCVCYACRPRQNGYPGFSRGAIRHLLSSGDPLGARLGALHNLTFYLERLETIRFRLAALAEIPKEPSKNRNEMNVSNRRRSL